MIKILHRAPLAAGFLIPLLLALSLQSHPSVVKATAPCTSNCAECASGYQATYTDDHYQEKVGNIVCTNTQLQTIFSSFDDIAQLVCDNDPDCIAIQYQVTIGQWFTCHPGTGSDGDFEMDFSSEVYKKSVNCAPAATPVPATPVPATPVPATPVPEQHDDCPAGCEVGGDSQVPIIQKPAAGQPGVDIADGLSVGVCVCLPYVKEILTDLRSADSNALTGATAIYLPNLERVEGDFQLSSVTAMTKLSAPKLRYVEGVFQIKLCNALQEIHLQALTTVRGDFELDKLAVLATLVAPNLDQVLGGIVIKYISLLQDLTFLSKLKHMQSLEIRGDCDTVTDLILPQLEMVHHDLHVECNSMKKIEMKSLTHVGKLSLDEQGENLALEVALFPVLQTASEGVSLDDLGNLKEVNFCSLRHADPESTQISTAFYNKGVHGSATPVAPAKCWVNRQALSPAAPHIPSACNADQCPQGPAPQPQAPEGAAGAFECPAECDIDVRTDFGDRFSWTGGNGEPCFCAPNVEIITSAEFDEMAGSLKKVYLPKLTHVSGELSFTDLPLLETIYVPRLQHIGYLTYMSSGAANAGPIELPRLTYVKEIFFRQTDLVTPFYAPLLTYVPGRIRMQSMGGMKSLSSLETLEWIGTGGLSCVHCSALEAIELPLLHHIGGELNDGAISIDADVLKTVSMPKISSMGARAEIRSRTALEKVHLPLLEDVFGELYIMSRGKVKSFEACRLRGFTAMYGEPTESGFHTDMNGESARPEHCAVGVENWFMIDGSRDTDACTRDACRVPCANVASLQGCKSPSGKITGTFDSTALIDGTSDCGCECVTDSLTGSTCNECAAGYGPSYPTCKPACTDASACNGKGTAGGYEGSCVCACAEGFDGPTCDKCKAGFGPTWPECLAATTAAPTTTSTTSSSSSSGSSSSSTTTTTAAPSTTATNSVPSTTDVSTSTPVSSHTGPMASCPIADTTFALTEGQRHRIEFLMSSATDGTQISCAFRFSCPTTSNGMAIRITKSVPQGSDLSVSADVPTTSGAVSFVSAATGLNAMFGRTEVHVTAFGNGGSIAMVASCITGTAKLPPKADDINYVGTDSPASRRQQEMEVDVTDASFKTYALPGSTQTEKALMLSCPSGDLTNGNPVVQILSIAGQLSPATNDALTVTALDSELVQTFSNISTVNSTFDRTTDVNTFAASSQYYVTWSSDRSTPAPAGLTISYSCANTAWFVSGAGVEQQSSGSAMPGYLLAAAIALIFTAV